MKGIRRTTLIWGPASPPSRWRWPPAEAAAEQLERFERQWLGIARATGLQINNPNSGGTPKTGGTLTVLGTSDVDDNLDPNYGYYTLDYVAYQLYERNLYTYPSVLGQTFTLAPDLATAQPTVSDGGLKYSVTIRNGAMWNTSPPRQVTAADVVRGVKRSCNPTFPLAGQPDISDILAGYTTFCNGFAKVSATSAAAQKAYIDGNNISGVTVDPSNPLTVDFTLTKPASYFPGTLNLSWANPVPRSSSPICRTAPPRPPTPSRTARTRSSPTCPTSRSCSCATRPGSSPATRSARPTSTRSTSPRPATSSRSISRS